MPDAPPGHGTPEHGGDMVLDQKIGEALGTVSASERDGHEGYWLREAEKKSASGTPKRHRASLSAATGKVLTRFTRRHPSDLGHLKHSNEGRVLEKAI